MSDADRATAPWQQQLADYLNLIAEWTQDPNESDSVFYHEKCLVYTALLDVVPAGSESDKILADYVDFVGNSNLYQESPAEWYMEPLHAAGALRQQTRAARQAAGGFPGLRQSCPDAGSNAAEDVQ